jgi:hypothetical protein
MLRGFRADKCFFRPPARPDGIRRDRYHRLAFLRGRLGVWCRFRCYVQLLAVCSALPPIFL